MTKGFSIYFALCIKNRMFYVLNDSVIATFSCLVLRIVLYNLAEITGKGQRTSHETLTTSFPGQNCVKGCIDE